MSLNYVTVTGTFDDGSGSTLPLTGQSAYCLFTPSTQVFANGIPVITPATPIQAPIVAGSLLGESGGALRLLATDNTGLSYGGLTGFFFWTVQVFINGQAQPPWSFFLPHTPGTVDLSALANTSAGGGGFSSPMTTLGDILFENASPAAARLAGNTAAVKNFLTQTGNGTISAAPAWGAIAAGDVPALVQYALLAGATYAGYVAPAVTVLTFVGSGTTLVNAAQGNAFNLTLTASTTTLGNPSNPVDGQVIRFRITQGGGGSFLLAYGTAYDFGAAGGPVLSITAGKVDILSFEYVASISKWCYLGSALGN